MSPIKVTLTDCVRAAARGDDLAWEVLVRRFTPALRSTARKYGLAPHEVDDVVQSCWLALLRSLDTVREPEAVGAWLVTAARREALRMLQREVRELLTDEPPGEVPVAESAEDVLIRAERTFELRNAMRRLPARQRTLLESILASPDASYADVSKQLGMPIGSIGPTRDRGLQRLRRDTRLARAVSV